MRSFTVVVVGPGLKMSVYFRPIRPRVLQHEPQPFTVFVPPETMGAPHLAFEMWDSTNPNPSLSSCHPRQWVPHISLLRCGTARTPTLHCLPATPRRWVPHISLLRCGQHNPPALTSSLPATKMGAPHLAFEMWAASTLQSSLSSCHPSTKRGAPHLAFEMWDSTNPNPSLSSCHPRQWVPHISLLRCGTAQTPALHCLRATRDDGCPTSRF